MKRGSLWMLPVCVVLCAGQVLAAPCEHGRFKSSIETQEGTLPVELCLSEAIVGIREGARVVSGQGTMTPGGPFSYDVAVGPERLELELNRGGLTQHLTFSNFEFTARQQKPDGQWELRSYENQNGGLFAMIDERQADGPVAFADQPLYAVALDLVDALDFNPSDLLMRRLYGAPGLQIESSTAVDVPRSEREITAMLRAVELEPAPPLDPVASLANRIEAVCVVATEETHMPQGLDECPRCIEDDQALAALEDFNLQVPGVGEVSVLGVAAYTKARCFEGPGNENCIRGTTGGGVNIAATPGGNCGDDRALYTFKAEGKGWAQSGTGDCLKDDDDYACAVRIKGPGFEYKKVCSTGENALCMRAEAEVTGEATLCMGNGPYFLGGLKATGSAGACGADGAGPTDPPTGGGGSTGGGGTPGGNTAPN